MKKIRLTRKAKLARKMKIISYLVSTATIISLAALYLTVPAPTSAGNGAPQLLNAARTFFEQNPD